MLFVLGLLKTVCSMGEMTFFEKKKSTRGFLSFDHPSKSDFLDDHKKVDFTHTTCTFSKTIYAWPKTKECELVFLSFRKSY